MENNFNKEKTSPKKNFVARTKTDAWLELLNRNSDSEIPLPENDPEGKYKEAHIWRLAKKLFKQAEKADEYLSQEYALELAQGIVKAQYEKQKQADQKSKNFETLQTKEQKAETALTKTTAEAEKENSPKDVLAKQAVEWAIMSLNEEWVIKKEMMRQLAELEAAKEFLEMIEYIDNEELRKHFQPPEVIQADIEKREAELYKLETTIKTNNVDKIKEEYPDLFSEENLKKASLERLSVTSENKPSQNDPSLDLVLDFMGSEEAVMLGWKTSFEKLSDIPQNFKTSMEKYFKQLRQMPVQSLLLALLEDIHENKLDLEGKISVNQIYTQIYLNVENKIKNILGLPEENYFSEIITNAIAETITFYSTDKIGLLNDKDKINAFYQEQEQQKNQPNRS